MNGASLLELTAHYHRHLNELMWLHQEALLVRDIALARRFFALYRGQLLAHIDAEDKRVFAGYQHLGIQGQWPLTLYRKEHEKIQLLLDKVEVMLASPAVAGRRAVIDLLDYQKTFKGVIEHHELREEKGLLPELQQHADNSLLADISAYCGNVWGELSAAQQPELTQALELLDRYDR